LDNLLQKSRDGNPDAFSDLSINVREISHSYFLSKHRLKKLGYIEDVDDLTNNVYLAFAEQYHNIDNLENWLRKVLFLTFVKWYKRNRAKATFQLDDNISSNEPAERSSDLIDAGTAITILKTLSDEKQEIVRLRIWGELKFSEIAEEMNKSEVAVKKMFYRTLNELKDKLE
jgi:RNA polymerase sigma-70 factor (ECF subfamily)